MSRFHPFPFVLVALALAGPANASDHKDGPRVTMDGRTDIADIYVFQGADPLNTVLAMTVTPDADGTSPEGFRTDDTQYQFVFDINQDLVADFQFSFEFKNPTTRQGSCRPDRAWRRAVSRPSGSRP